MSRLNPANVALAGEIIGRYPVPKSATIPLCHLAQEQDGHLSEEAMAHIAELVGVTPAEVLGTASFYEMFKREAVGRYFVNVCTSISCFLSGGDELLHHAEERLGVKAGGTTTDGRFTLEEYECIAACTEAPCLQVNYRYFHKVTNDDFDRLVDDLGAGRLDGSVPPHGVLQRTRQHVPAERAVGPVGPDGATQPPWMTDEPALRRPAGPPPPAEPGDEPGPVPEAASEVPPGPGPAAAGAAQAVADDVLEEDLEGVPQPRDDAAPEPAGDATRARPPADDRGEPRAPTGEAATDRPGATPGRPPPGPTRRPRNRKGKGRRPPGGTP
ncbi:MAG: NADH-quinone oxidoreductase subunit NuoE family protein [Acidimicrobiia bacterium]